MDSVEKNQALTKLKAAFPNSIIEAKEFRGDITVTIKKEDLLSILQFLRDDEELKFNHLTSISGIDYLKMEDVEGRLAVVYHLYSLKNNRRLAIKTFITGDSLEIDSVYSLWKTADWQEREIYDLFGITFKGHPLLKRIFLPEDFEGHPLRKDYPLEGRGERSRFDYEEG